MFNLFSPLTILGGALEYCGIDLSTDKDQGTMKNMALHIYKVLCTNPKYIIEYIWSWIQWIVMPIWMLVKGLGIATTRC